MSPDEQIREDVVRALAGDPRLSAGGALGVAVQDGAVTLTGHVRSYAEKIAAFRAAAATGVRAVADDLQVRVPGQPRDDTDLAEELARVLERDPQLPAGAIKARVQSGWVTLEGEVRLDGQQRAVVSRARGIQGVLGVISDIKVTPQAAGASTPAGPRRDDDIAADVHAMITSVLKEDPAAFSVTVQDGVVRLTGSVSSPARAAAAARLAAKVYGVADVIDDLDREPLGA